MPTELKPVAEALARICAALMPVSTQQVSFAAAADRILADDIVAAYDHPPAAVSAMDGYAVHCGGQTHPVGSRCQIWISKEKKARGFSLSRIF